MRETEHIDDSIYQEKVPGSGGIFSHAFFAVFGTAVIIWTLCYATNFVCEFAGIDFNAFLWVEEFVDGFPALLDSWIELVKGLLETAMGFVE